MLIKENTMHTDWFSFKQRLRERKLHVRDAKHPSMEDAIKNALTVLESYKLALRFEFTVPKNSNNGAIIWLRALPVEAQRLNDDARLNGHDVKSMAVEQLPTIVNLFADRMVSFRSVYPFAPMIFSKEPITLNQACVIILSVKAFNIENRIYHFYISLKIFFGGLNFFF